MPFVNDISPEQVIGKLREAEVSLSGPIKGIPKAGLA